MVHLVMLVQKSPCHAKVMSKAFLWSGDCIRDASAVLPRGLVESPFDLSITERALLRTSLRIFGLLSH